MAPPRAARLWAGISIMMALLSGMVTAEPSIVTDYCATVNTASMAAFYSDFQSQGRCHGNCTDLGAALAIVQWKNCWCSDLVPSQADQKSLSSCQESCPGYPDDYCGGQGTFGYMKLKNPSGTAPPGVTNTKTSSVTILPPVGSLPESSTVEPVTTRAPNTNDKSPTSEPTVQTVTVGGTVKTVTATPDPTGQPQFSDTGNGGLSTGATVGIAIGVVGVFATAAILMFIYCLKRRRKEEDTGFVPSRRSSPNGLSTPGTGEVSEARFGDGSISGTAWDGSAANPQRRSHLMPIDPRLDPFAKGIYVRDHNKSHESVGSLQDNHDYSRRIQDPPRVLRATNPDPDY